MGLPALSVLQWTFGVLAALLLGFTKTGIPGAGILVVPLLANIFGGRLAVGSMVPLLIFGDLFAVAFYRRNTRWDKLRELLPAVVFGMALGGLVLWKLGEQSGKDRLNPVLGLLVLTMLAIHLARLRWGSRWSLSTPAGVLGTGTAAGFATTVSNAAGPIMSIYMTNLGLAKAEFMGTTAWYYFLFNWMKVPIYLFLMRINPTHPFFTSSTLRFDLVMAPVIVLGASLGRWLLPRIDQKRFDVLVLTLSALMAINLLR
jgi:uncharacterized membrane protein YfcA